MSRAKSNFVLLFLCTLLLAAAFASASSSSLVASKVEATIRRLANAAKRQKQLSHFEKNQQKIVMSPPSPATTLFDECDQVRRLGFECRHLNVTTPDGFTLDVLHVPPRPSFPTKNIQQQKRQNSASSSKKFPLGYPVLLQHGVCDSAVTWFSQATAAENLGTMLASSGAAVYAPNARCTAYSPAPCADEKKHISSSSSSSSLSSCQRRCDWDFMIHDWVTLIDFALNHSGFKTTAIAAHSQAGLTSLALFTLPESREHHLGDKVAALVTLAPVVFLRHQESAVFQLMADLHLAEVLLDLNVLNFCGPSALLRDVAAIPGAGDLISEALMLITGNGSVANLNASQWKTVSRYDPGGIGTFDLEHWMQMAREKKRFVLQMHDYGKSLNEKYYNQSVPPQYYLSNFSSHSGGDGAGGGGDEGGTKKSWLSIFWGSNDYLTAAPDVMELVRQLKTSAGGRAALKQVVEIEGYEHLDFTMAVTAHTVLFPRVIEAMLDNIV